MFLKRIASIRGHLSNAKPLLLWLIGAWLAYRLMLNGYRKFDPEGMWTGAFDRWGYPVWFRYLIGFLEVGGGLLVLIPKLRHFGALILCIVMIGALATRIINGTGLDDALSISYYAIAFLYLAAYHGQSNDHQSS